MTISELRFKDIQGKKISRPSWNGAYLLVFGWEYNGTDFAYSPLGSAPYGMMFNNGKRYPFAIKPGHDSNDWEILD